MFGANDLFALDTAERIDAPFIADDTRVSGR